MFVRAVLNFFEEFQVFIHKKWDKTVRTLQLSDIRIIATLCCKFDYKYVNNEFYFNYYESESLSVQ